MKLLFLLVAILSGCMVEKQHGPQQVSDMRYTAFIHVNVLPMTSEIIKKDQTILIEGDRIIAVGPGRSVTIPENATIINGFPAACVWILPFQRVGCPGRIESSRLCKMNWAGTIRIGRT